MITSLLFSTNPLLVRHTLSSTISEIESQKGVDDAIELINANVPEGEKFGMLIDVSSYSFETLEARRIWSLQFKMNEDIQKRADFVAIVGSPNEAFNTEKLWMETTKLKFFEKDQDAEKWLLESKSNPTMCNYKKVILERICYTELVYGRINKKLNIELSKEKIEEMILSIIKQTDDSGFIKTGKNIYITNIERNVRLTINSYTNRIITADKLNKNIPSMIR